MFSFDDPKTIANLIVGIIVTSLGLIPLLNMFGIIGFTLPTFLANIISQVALYVIAGFGLWLLIDGFMEDDRIRMITIFVALIVIALGILPLLGSFGIIPEIPFLSFVLNPMVFNIIFVIEGILLLIAAWATF